MPTSDSIPSKHSIYNDETDLWKCTDSFSQDGKTYITWTNQKTGKSYEETYDSSSGNPE